MIRSSRSIIIPVKPVGIGKSRLRSGDPAEDDLVTAIALDTIEAALAAVADRTGSTVLVVTDDPHVAGAAAALGALVTPDPSDTGLNAAIVHGESRLSPTTTRAALTADLPALRPDELAAALDTFHERLAGKRDIGRRGYVSDHLGTGTTLLIAPPSVPLGPRFGPASAAAHAASGAFALIGPWPTLRLDVDTRIDLDVARTLGLGPRTSAVLAAAWRLRSADAGNGRDL
jgi:2-phospho-L-lactate guanylyltransferase